VQAGASYPLILKLPGFAHFLQPHAPRGLPVLPGGVGGQLLRLLGLRELLVFAEIQPRWRLIARFGLPLPQATADVLHAVPTVYRLAVVEVLLHPHSLHLLRPPHPHPHLHLPHRFLAKIGKTKIESLRLD